MIEALVASLIMSTCVAAMVSTLSFSQNMTTQSIDMGVAYNLARQTMETVKQTGFANTAEASVAAPVTTYYDGNMNSVVSGSLARYKVTLSVVSSTTVSGSSPVQPTTDALRTVTVKVFLQSTSALIYRMDSYLVNNGT